MFQSTHPHGVRPKRTCSRNMPIFVSIHAPTRGATLQTFRVVQYEMFQSTHPHGVRPAPNCEVGTTPRFQSTHPHGVRHNGHYCRHQHKRFQSTHPHGVRPFTLPHAWLMPSVSIHAPTRGATILQMFLCAICASFNPRTHTGCDFCSARIRPTRLCFNPRTHTGCDFCCFCFSCCCICFNPRTHTGCDSDV